MTDKQMSDNYRRIVKIVIDNLKQESKTISTTPINNWAGDGYFTKKQLQTITLKRKQRKKGAKMLLEALKLMGY